MMKTPAWPRVFRHCDFATHHMHTPHTTMKQTISIAHYLLRIPGDCRCRSLLQLKVLPTHVTAQRVSIMQFEPSHIVLLVILAPWP